MKINRRNANKIYDILVRECQADFSEDTRQRFIRYFVEEDGMEWRFGGNLGFGGKFNRTYNRIYVDCYSENETPARKTIVDKVNKLLEKIPLTIYKLCVSIVSTIKKGNP